MIFKALDFQGDFSLFQGLVKFWIFDIKRQPTFWQEKKLVFSRTMCIFRTDFGWENGGKSWLVAGKKYYAIQKGFFFHPTEQWMINLGSKLHFPKIRMKRLNTKSNGVGENFARIQKSGAEQPGSAGSRCMNHLFFGLSTKCIFVSYEIRYCCWVGTSRINQDGVILKLLGGPKRWALLSFCSLWPILGFDLQLGCSSSSGIDTRRIYEGCRRSVA